MADSQISRHGSIQVPPLVSTGSHSSQQSAHGLSPQGDSQHGSQPGSKDANPQKEADIIAKLKANASSSDLRHLENIPLFRGLSTEDMAALFNHAVIRTYKKNTIVIHEGDFSDSLFVILSGKVRVYLSDEDGKEVDLNILEMGAYFGELAALDSFPRSASVITVAESKFMVISKKEFDICLTKNPQIAVRIIDELTSRFRSMTENVKSLALMDVYGRVARTLINLAAESDEGKLVIQQKLTQQDLANMVGASREMVSRILKDLTRGGYITIKNKYITIEEKLPHAW